MNFDQEPTPEEKKVNVEGSIEKSEEPLTDKELRLALFYEPLVRDPRQFEGMQERRKGFINQAKNVEGVDILELLDRFDKEKKRTLPPKERLPKSDSPWSRDFSGPKYVEARKTFEEERKKYLEKFGSMDDEGKIRQIWAELRISGFKLKSEILTPEKIEQLGRALLEWKKSMPLHVPFENSIIRIIQAIETGKDISV